MKLTIPVSRATVEYETSTDSSPFPLFPCQALREAVLRRAGRSTTDGILVVDDEPSTLEFVKTALEQVGYRVVAVSTCQEAWAWLQDMVYDVVVLDIRLPDGDGLGLLAQIRALDAQQPVLLISGVATAAEVRTGIRLGAKFCRKPIPIADLWHLVGGLQRNDLRLLRPGVCREQRRHGRAELQISAEIQPVQDANRRVPDSQMIEVRDVSMGGLRAEFNTPPAVGHDVEVKLHLPGQLEPVSCSAQVVWVEGRRAGLRLKSIEAPDLARLFESVALGLWQRAKGPSETPDDSRGPQSPS